MQPDHLIADAVGEPDMAITPPANPVPGILQTIVERRTTGKTSVTRAQVEKLLEHLKDKSWRMANLYLVLDDKKQMRQFKPRREQAILAKNRHSQNFIPKARKLGMSTYIVLDNLDECIFGRDMRAGIIDLKQTDAEDKLAIATYAWDNGPKSHPNPAIRWLWREIIHKRNPITDRSKSRIAWKNGAAFSAGVRYTGKTPNRLHVSEFGPIAASDPKVALDIVRGSINSVHTSAGGIIDIETTMEGGRIGECYKIYKQALDSVGKSDLSPLDWKMHFFSWLGHPLYVLPGREPTEAATLEYFLQLTKEHGEWIEREFGFPGGVVPKMRQAWWEGKRRTLGDLIWQQFPSVVKECDMAAISGQIYPEMAQVRVEGRVTWFNPEVHIPFVVSADLGSSVNSALWLHQPAGAQHNIIDCAMSDSTPSMKKGAYWLAEQILKWEQQYGFIAQVLLPHDASITDKGSGMTYVENLVKAGIPRAKIMVVPRTRDVWVGIDAVRKLLPNVWFHERCDKGFKNSDGEEKPSGVARLENYRVKHNETGQANVMPHKDGTCDHCADALRTYAEAKELSLVNVQMRHGRRQKFDTYDDFLEAKHGHGAVVPGPKVVMNRP